MLLLCTEPFSFPLDLYRLVASDNGYMDHKQLGLLLHDTLQVCKRDFIKLTKWHLRIVHALVTTCMFVFPDSSSAGRNRSVWW